VSTACTNADCVGRGGATVGLCGGGPGGVNCSPSGTDTDSHVIVYTLNAANNANEAHPFFVAAF